MKKLGYFISSFSPSNPAHTLSLDGCQGIWRKTVSRESIFMCVVKQFRLRLAYIINGLLGWMLPPHPWSVFTEQAATVGGLACLSSNTLPLCPQPTLRDEQAAINKNLIFPRQQFLLITSYFMHSFPVDCAQPQLWLLSHTWYAEKKENWVFRA